MAGIDFHSPSYRAASSDLTVAISPLGLVELADEEFEVHGPRLNRYAQAWAFYLGHHWGYRREMGEPQVTFNYVKAFVDYICNFTFGRGVSFRSPKETEAIVPSLLKRVWEVDNKKDQVLWEMGHQGGVTGDCFVKVAYEEAYVDNIGRIHPGRVRILPLNASFCFPEWHPHDRNRLLRFKLKYRFWGTSKEGTRQVFTYTEIITDAAIEEYINDELIDSRPNPLGVVPVIHIANMPVSGSPWGLSDAHDIFVLNREYNEKATDISDIINYHAAPVTVITGAKASQLEKGPKKVWGGLPKDAQVFNLELGGNLQSPLEYLELLKRSMHELTGVPETALGQIQPISNTSGVALSIQFQPLMNRYNLKKVQYGAGIERINELILLTLAVKEPNTFVWDENTDVPLKEYQMPQLDPSDPITYQTMTTWPAPLPVDVLVKLNEIQAKMALGLESKRGALRELGIDEPDEKAAEIFNELVEDAKDQAALDLLKAQAASIVMAATGVIPSGDGTHEPVEQETTSAGGSNVNTAASAPALGQIGGPLGQFEMVKENELAAQIVTKAYGTKLAQRRNPDKE